MDDPPVVLAVPAVVLTMGYCVPTSMLEVSLSRVTVRGEEITLVSAYLLRNDKTKLTPSAFRKKVAGFRPLALSTDKPPLPRMESSTVLAPALLPAFLDPVTMELESESDGVVVV